MILEGEGIMYYILLAVTVAGLTWLVTKAYDMTKQKENGWRYCNGCLHCIQIQEDRCKCTIHGTIYEDIRFCGDKELPI